MNQTEWIDDYNVSTNKLVLLDYDGTLVEHQSDPSLAIPSQRIIGVLNRLVEKNQTTVVVISGRSHIDIDRFLGRMPICIIAEHGAMIKENGVWKKQFIDNGIWKKRIISVMNDMVDICPGSFVEEKFFSVTWHYRNAEIDSGYTYSRKLILLLELYKSEFNLKILDGNKVVEVMNTNIGKGRAVKELLLQNNYKYIVAIGDDETDEDMFAFLSDNHKAATIKVGKGKTCAKFKVKNVESTRKLLEKMLDYNLT